MARDPFEFREITYDSSIRTYIFRVIDTRTNKIANVTVADAIKNSMNSNSAYISLAGKNADGSKSEIIQNDSTDKAESFKAIFEKDKKAPLKVFIKNENGKWEHLKEPSNEFIERIKSKRLFLTARIEKSPKEGCVFLVR